MFCRIFFRCFRADVDGVGCIRYVAIRVLHVLHFGSRRVGIGTARAGAYAVAVIAIGTIAVTIVVAAVVGAIAVTAIVASCHSGYKGEKENCFFHKWV